MEKFVKSSKSLNISKISRKSLYNKKRDNLYKLLNHFRYRRGYKNVINKAIELNEKGVDCQLAIETSGHAAMKENYFLDDGAYLATKIVIRAAQLAAEGKTIDQLLDSLVLPKESREIRMKITCEEYQEFGDALLKEVKDWAIDKGFQLTSPNYEGVRIR